MMRQQRQQFKIKQDGDWRLAARLEQESGLPEINRNRSDEYV